MQNNYFYSAILFLSLLSVGCSEDKLKQPVRTGFIFAVSQQSFLPDELEIEAVQLRLLNFDFEGERLAGDDYPFTQKFADTLVVVATNLSSQQITSFDLPQGEYSRMTAALEVPKSSGKRKKKGRPDISLNGGGIAVLGKYKSKKGNQSSVVPIRFEYSSSLVLDYIMQNSGNTVLNNSGELSPEIVLEFDPGYWLEELNINRLKNAKTVKIDGLETLVISESINEKVYEDLIRRLEKANKIKVKK